MNSNDLTPVVDGPVPAYEDEYVSLILRDGLDLPIPDLQVFVTMPSGEICKATTTVQGAVTVPMAEPRSGTLKVAVQDAQGNQQDICALDAARCKKVVIVRSPKVTSKTKLRLHQEPKAAATTAPPAQPRMAHHTQPGSRPVAPASAAHAPASGAPSNSSLAEAPAHWWWNNGALTSAWNRLTDAGHINQAFVSAPPGFLAQLRNAIGQPLDLMAGPECPNKDNLRLGRNNMHRPYILAAAARLGLIPQAICALVDCEALSIKDVVPVVDKHGKPVKYTTGKLKGKPMTHELGSHWKVNSLNVQRNKAGKIVGDAAGLTQFLRLSWLSQCMTPGTFIHDKCVELGWVKQEKQKTGGLQWVFVLSDNTTTRAPSSHLEADDEGKPCDHKNAKHDDNIKKCLAKRMDPEWSIHAAADYGKANLKALEDAGLNLAGLNDMEKAKLMYLMHHEGPGGGKAFIRNKIAPTEDAKKKLKGTFVNQVGAETAADRIKKTDDDVEAAYRKWLAEYVDSKFQLDNTSKYFCGSPVEAVALTKLMKQIGGESL